MGGHDHDHGHGHGRGHATGCDGHAHPARPAPAREEHAAHAHDHAHGGSHDHTHAARAAGESRVALLLALVATYMGVEAAAGWWSGSLALLADAGHMVSDAAALAITLWAMRMVRRPATPARTWGWHRAEILAAAVNGAALLAIAVGILWEAAGRLSQPVVVDAPVVVGVAAGGLLVNLAGLALLHGDREAGHNLRAAWLHVLSDALGSAGALLAGGLAWGFGWTWADPVASVLIALLVLRGAWVLLDEAVHVLMEGAPAHIDVDAVRAALQSVAGVRGVHDLHVWTITSGQVSLSAHVAVAADAPPGATLHALVATLRDRFGIRHATLQLEPPDFEEPDTEELHP